MDNSFITQSPTNSFSQRRMISKDEFNKKYRFNQYQIVTVINPKDYDYPFMSEGRHFVIKGGDRQELPGPIANVYLDNMTRIVAQDDDKLGFMGDPNLASIYYDQLIVGVTSTLPDFDNTPEYLKNVPAHLQGTAPTEVAPWDAAQGERASDVARTVAPPAPQWDPPEPPKQPTEPTKAPEPAKEETKIFEQGGNKFKMVIGKDGRRMHYRDGSLISSADYNKAASML